DSPCSLTLFQSKVSAGSGLERVEFAAVLSAGSQQVVQVALRFPEVFVNLVEGGTPAIWQLEIRSAPTCYLPNWLTTDYDGQGPVGIPAGSNFTFGYLWNSLDPATIAISEISCNDPSLS